MKDVGVYVEDACVIATFLRDTKDRPYFLMNEIDEAISVLFLVGKSLANID